MTQNALDLSLIPAPDAVMVIDHAAKVAELKADLIEAMPALAPVLALESEPLVKLIEVWAYEAILKANEINQGVRAVLLTLATGSDLDNVATNLGVVRQLGESDERFRARAVLGPEGWSTAGPIGAYLFHALSASPDVADVAVSSPEPGEVRVAVLSSAEDGVADTDLLAIVFAALTAEDVRPLTDNVLVVSASVASYDVVATAKVLAGPDAGPITSLITAAVETYAASRRKLNRSVTRAGLVAALMQAGVEDVELVSPADDLAAAPETAPVLGSINLTLQVLA